MRDKELYGTILGITTPWRVADVALRLSDGEVEVSIEHDGTPLQCPQCQARCARYDARRRTWRHLDTCQYRTLLTAEVPRVKCPNHGVLQIAVPWAEPNARFTAMFESLAIDWLRETSITGVARRMNLTWDELDGIQQRAVRRGLARRTNNTVTHLGIDETSFQKRHSYVTVVSDLKGARVIDVVDGRDEDSLASFYQSLKSDELAKIQVVAMDMWRAYINATRKHVPNADAKIAFDRFHVAKHLNEAVNAVRKREHRELLSDEDDRLKRTKYLWLMSPERRRALPRDRASQFAQLRSDKLKVARAWAIKETARDLWAYTSRAWAQKAWKKWMGWAMRCRLEPMRAAAYMVKKHLWGMLNAIVLNVTNATSESLNAKIQWVKKNGCGFRNRARFRTAVLFHCGELDLHPRLLAHTKA
jgi:transposase